MTVNVKLKQLPWKLIVILAAIALVRPILSTVGLFDDIRPAGPLLATALIAFAWIVIAVWKKLKNPVAVLAAAGATYAVASIVLAIILQLGFDWGEADQASIPMLLTGGLIGSLAINVIWGGLLGFVASLLIQPAKKSNTSRRR